MYIRKKDLTTVLMLTVIASIAYSNSPMFLESMPDDWPFSYCSNDSQFSFATICDKMPSGFTLKPPRTVLPVFSFNRKDDNEARYPESVEKPSYFKNLWTDFKDTYSAPFHWNKKGWTTFFLISGISVAIYLNDERIMEYVQENKSQVSQNVAKAFEYFGNPLYVLPGSIALYGYGLVFKNENIERIALLSFKSTIITTAVFYTLKYLTHRHRPNSGARYNVWDGPGFEFKNRSFVSGHTAISFSLATIFSHEVKNTFLSVLAYGTAALTGFSRVHDQKHWASDVFVGAAIGYFITRYLIRKDAARRARHRKTKLQKIISKISILPLMDRETCGFSLVYQL